MTHDVTRLPKWAQQKIERLEREVLSYRERADKMEAGDTDVFVKRYAKTGSQMDNVALPPHSTIIFQLADRVSIELEKSDRWGWSGVEVYAYGDIHSLLFMPLSNNHGVLFNRNSDG